VADLRRVDVNLIVVLDAILRERNLTHAGDAVGMTQPAVSGALARLRQQFNDPLLIRQGRSFELTPLAASMESTVAQAMTEIQRTLDLLPTFEPATSTRSFSIAASDYVLSQVTAPLLSLIGQSAPGVSLEFESLPAGVSLNALDLLRRDVVIAGTGRGVPGKKQSLFSDEFVCIADRNNPRLRERSLSLLDLEELRHVRSTFGEEVVTHIDDMLASGGVSPHVGVSVQGFLAVPLLVSGTAMIGHVPLRLALQYQDVLGLVIARTPLRAPVLVEAAHWHPSKTADPALRWLVAQLRSAAEIIELNDDSGASAGHATTKG
jgi:DNA-binding transcriptional LysR family regulator